MTVDGSKMDFQVFMATCNRKPAYVHASLKSLFSDPAAPSVDVVVCGASDTGFLDRWRSDPRIRIHEAGDDEKKLARRSFIERRILFTFVRALELADPKKTVLFFEDDVQFTKNWVRKAKNFKKLIDERFVHSGFTKERYVLALYTAEFPKSDRTCGRHSIAPYHPGDFHCTAGFMLEGFLARELAAFARKKIKVGDWLASDMMLKRFAWDGLCDLRASNPSLVNHTGDQSTQGFFSIRRAPSFESE